MSAQERDSSDEIQQLWNELQLVIEEPSFPLAASVRHAAKHALAGL